MFRSIARTSSILRGQSSTSSPSCLLAASFNEPINFAARCSNGKRSISTTNCDHAKVGFVGLGNMGSNMATHLKNKGHEMFVYDPNETAMKDLVSIGAHSAANPADVAKHVDRLFTMVPTPQDVLNIYTGPNGIIANAQKDSILMDSSTVDPETSRKIEAAASAAGIRFLDAPVTGAVPAARAGTLTFIVGGPKETVDEIRDLLLCMGKNVIHCGPTGMGSVAKLCNNMMLAISAIGCAETLHMAERMGLDPKLMNQILNISSGRTWVSEGYCPVPGVGDEKTPSNQGYHGGFKSALIAKDLGLAVQMSSSSQSPIPMGAMAAQWYRTMVNNGCADLDFTVVYQFLKGLTKQ